MEVDHVQVATIHGAGMSLSV